MPDPKTCAAKFKPGTQAYKDCIAYKKPAVKAKPVNEMSRVRTAKKGGY